MIISWQEKKANFQRCNFLPSSFFFLLILHPFLVSSNKEGATKKPGRKKREMSRKRTPIERWNAWKEVKVLGYRIRFTRRSFTFYNASYIILYYTCTLVHKCQGYYRYNNRFFAASIQSQFCFRFWLTNRFFVDVRWFTLERGFLSVHRKFEGVKLHRIRVIWTDIYIKYSNYSAFRNIGR